MEDDHERIEKKNTKSFAVNRDTCATADNHSHLIE